MSAVRTTSAIRLDDRAAMAVLAREGVRPTHWSSAPGDTYATHSHAYDKVLYCVRGSIVFRMRETGEEFELGAGDRLEIDAGTEHSAAVGHEGVACVEAARGVGRAGG